MSLSEKEKSDILDLVKNSGVSVEEAILNSFFDTDMSFNDIKASVEDYIKSLKQAQEKRNILELEIKKGKKNSYSGYKKKKAGTEKKEKTAEEIKAEQEKSKKEEEAINKLIVEQNKNIKCDNKTIAQHYTRLRRAIELVAKGYFNSGYIHSKAGLGKSYQTTAILNELNVNYVIFAGDISEAYLYRFLYENNGKIIIFRDLVKLITNLRSIDILKAVTETHGKRIVRKANYSKFQDDLPSYFECNSRFLFEFNNLHFNGLKDDIEALFSRGDYVSLVFSLEDLNDIMLQICKDNDEKEITNYLLSNYNFIGMNTLNLRTQNKAFQIYKYAKENNKEWKSELDIFLKSEMTPTRKILYSLIGNKVIKTRELKSLLIKAQIDGISHLRTADRRIQDWLILEELNIVGLDNPTEECIDNYVATHRNFAVCINPTKLSDTNDKNMG